MTKSLLKNNGTSIMAVTILLLLLASTGCSKKETPAPAPPTKAEPAKTLPVPPVQKQSSSATKASSVTGAQFDFGNRKDPFKPYIAPKAATPVATETSGKNLLPIHRFEINQFRVIGVVTGGKENQAMVVDPGGKGYVLKTGMTIGKSEARVTAITSKGIEVLEQFRDDNGRVHKQRITLTLPRKE